MADESKFAYFFLGLGIGVSLGILFAPNAGRETRVLIRDKAGEGTDFIKRRGGEIRESATDWLERGKEVIGRQKDQLAAAVEAGKQAYRESLSDSEPAAQPQATS